MMKRKHIKTKGSEDCHLYADLLMKLKLNLAIE
jgi:hypothetical protein